VAEKKEPFGGKQAPPFGKKEAKTPGRKPRKGEVTPTDKAMGKAERHYTPKGQKSG